MAKLMEYGKMLKMFRINADLSQEEMAEQLNCTQSCISKYETEKKPIDLKTFVKWAKITECQELGAAMLFGMDTLNTVMQIIPLLPVALGGFAWWIL